MFKAFLLCLFLILSTPGTPQIASVEPASALSQDSARAAVHHIHLVSKSDEATCSSTAVAPHALLTAAHCIIGTGKLMVDDSKHVATIDRILYDEEDHAIIFVTDMTFSAYLKIEERAPIIGETVSLWGWPGHSTDPLYREGVCVGVEAGSDDGDPSDSVLYHFRLPVFPGDSGSGLLDAAGNIITVVSLGDKSANEYSTAMTFTPTQLASVN